MSPSLRVTLHLTNTSRGRLEEICDILGFPFCDYECLEISALEEFLVQTKKRKAIPIDNSSKRHCPNPPNSTIGKTPATPFFTIYLF